MRCHVSGVKATNRNLCWIHLYLRIKFQRWASNKAPFTLVTSKWYSRDIADLHPHTALWKMTLSIFMFKQVSEVQLVSVWNQPWEISSEPSHRNRALFQASHSLKHHYNMNVWILARNGTNFSMAAGLIRLHMPSVNQCNLVCNKDERLSPYSQYQSLSLFIKNSSNHWCQKQNCNLQ